MANDQALPAFAHDTEFQFKYRKVLLKDRVLAYLIDTAWFWFFYFLISFGLGMAFLGRYAPTIAILIAYFMFLLRDGFNGGAGFGKGQRNSTVINVMDYRDCSYGQAFIRNIVSQMSAFALAIQFGYAIPFNALFFLVTAVDIWRIIKTEDGRRVGDMIAHTQVVYIDDTVQHKIELEKYRNVQAQIEVIR